MNIKEARIKLSQLIDQVERGQQIVLFRRGKAVAKLSPVDNDEEKRLPSLNQFRDSIRANALKLF